MRRWLAPAAALALACLALSPRCLATEPETLDGTFWKVRDGSFLQKIVFWRFDHVSFSEGLFRSATFQARGFAAAPYSASKSVQASIAWTATLASQEQGKVVWEGRRIGKRMEGTWIWRTPDGTTRRMPWSARQAPRDYVHAAE